MNEHLRTLRTYVNQYANQLQRKIQGSLIISLVVVCCQFFNAMPGWAQPMGGMTTMMGGNMGGMGGMMGSPMMHGGMMNSMMSPQGDCQQGQHEDYCHQSGSPEEADLISPVPMPDHGASLHQEHAIDLGKDVLRGEVLDVYELSSKRGLRSDTYLLLRTLLRTLGQVWEVQLAPETYLEAQDFELEPEDWVEITGQRFRRRGQSTFLAFTVASGEKTLVLRNEQGRPLW